MTATFALVTATLAGCEVTDPRELLNPCVNAAAIGIEQNQAKDVVCDLKTLTVLVGLPRGPASIDELRQKGLPPAAAEMMSHVELTTSRWCFLDAPEASTQPRLDRVECVETQTPIERLFVVTGRQFRLTLNRGEGAVVSIGFIKANDNPTPSGER
jgi:hypothetical protein